MVKESPARRRSRLAICRHWLGWALLASAIVCFWVLLDQTAYLWLDGLF